MVQVSIDDVAPGQAFSYAGRWYTRVVEDELAKHPASGKPNTVLAYSMPDRGNRVPVSVKAGINVFVKKGA